MSGLTIYGYSKITGVNRATLRAWLVNHPGNDSDMVSCSLSHEEEIFMNKDKNSRADSDLSAAVCASAGASNPGDLSSPRIEYNAERETASVRDLERCLEEKNKLLEEEKKPMEGKMIELKVELKNQRIKPTKLSLKLLHSTRSYRWPTRHTALI